jgi:adenylosuccinate synthase
MSGAVVIGAQWGDEGKGKIVDLLAERFEIVARYQGGNNAGHTVVHGDETFKFHLLPSGILEPDKICILGNGVVIDPEVLVGELDALEARGRSTAGLRISMNAHVIMPWHRLLDSQNEVSLGSLQIGTTRRGIGPAYADKASRVGIRVQDLFDLGILQKKVAAALAVRNREILRGRDQGPLYPNKVVEELAPFAARLEPYAADTSLLIDQALKAGKRVLFEGAQGTLLDLDNGTYPFVTSSNPIAGGACTGTGVGPTKIDSVLGIAKAYLTRVGAGPFPSEADEERGTKIRDIGAEFGEIGVARRHHAQPGFHGLRFVLEHGGVPSRVGHHIFHIDTRFSEGNGFGKDGTLDRFAECGTPLTRTTRPGIVGSRCQRL